MSFQERNNPQIDREKLERDIAFLTDRIAAMKLQPKPNHLVIAHYEAMLRSRTAVLDWLVHGDMDITTSKRFDRN